MNATLDRLRAWMGLLPLLLLLGATYWLNKQVQPYIPHPDANKRHDPDLIVDNFYATTMNEHGTPRYILSARKLMHYPDDDSTHLDMPQLKNLYPDEPPIYTYAKKGEVSKKGDEVFLRDEVKLVRSAQGAQSEMTFATSYLHILPDRNLADTQAPVAMNDAHTSVAGVGMTFDYAARTANLLSQVRSQHETIRH
jgi:lipopolysaccharide export system protein LptC